MAEWLKLSLRAPAANIDAAIAELWSLGTIGLEQHLTGGTCLIQAYFESSAGLPAVAMEAGSVLWDRIGVELEGAEAVAGGDWLAEYRRHSAVFPLGRGFLVDPREPGLPIEDAEGRALLRLPARQAFGTGSHESTRLVVEWLEGRDLRRTTVLDIGTGTGVLAFVALALGAPRVVAVEIDPAAGFMARLNQSLNRVVFPLFVGGVAALASSASFDMAVVNVLPHRIAQDLERLAILVRPAGIAIFSGLLRETSTEVHERLAQLGFAARDRLRSGEWEALVVEREVA